MHVYRSIIGGSIAVAAAAAVLVNVLYFAAGPNDENNGLFGRIDAQ